METLTTLKVVLNNINNFEWFYALYLPEDEVWELQTKCAVLDLQSWHLFCVKLQNSGNHWCNRRIQL